MLLISCENGGNSAWSFFSTAVCSGNFSLPLCLRPSDLSIIITYKLNGHQLLFSRKLSALDTIKWLTRRWHNYELKQENYGCILIFQKLIKTTTREVLENLIPFSVEWNSFELRGKNPFFVLKNVFVSGATMPTQRNKAVSPSWLTTGCCSVLNFDQPYIYLMQENNWTSVYFVIDAATLMTPLIASAVVQSVQKMKGTQHIDFTIPVGGRNERTFDGLLREFNHSSRGKDKVSLHHNTDTPILTPQYCIVRYDFEIRYPKFCLCPFLYALLQHYLRERSQSVCSF